MPHSWLQNESNKDRLVFFCDAIFAIAITILILQIDVPEVINSETPAATLVELWPSFMSYAISFFVIGRFWISHLNLYTYVKRVDMKLIVNNLVFMAFIVFLPFPTAFYGTHSENLFTLSFYIFAIVATSIASGVMWHYVYRHPELLKDNVHAKTLRRKAWHGILIPAEFLIALAIIWIFPIFLDWFWLFFAGVVVVIVVGNRLIESLEKKELHKLKSNGKSSRTNKAK